MISCYAASVKALHPLFIKASPYLNPDIHVTSCNATQLARQSRLVASGHSLMKRPNLNEPTAVIPGQRRTAYLPASYRGTSGGERRAIAGCCAHTGSPMTPIASGQFLRPRWALKSAPRRAVGASHPFCCGGRIKLVFNTRQQHQRQRRQLPSFIALVCINRTGARAQKASHRVCTQGCSSRASDSQRCRTHKNINRLNAFQELHPKLSQPHQCSVSFRRHLRLNADTC
jgi:hypothetical protein